MAFNLRNRSFLKELDFTPDELRFLLRLSAELSPVPSEPVVGTPRRDPLKPTAACPTNRVLFTVGRSLIDDQATAVVVERPVELRPSDPDRKAVMLRVGFPWVGLVILLVIPPCRNATGQERTRWTSPPT